MEKSLEALQSDLAEIKAKIEKCDQLMGKASPEQKEKLVTRRLEYEAQRDRLTLAIDLLKGRACGIINEDGQPYIIKPKDSLAQVIKVAEEYGARIVSIIPNRKEASQSPFL